MKKNSKTKSVKSVKRGRRSMKGKWGHVGAPPKKTSWPNRPFTMATLFSRNKNQCELSLRNKVDAGVATGNILALMPKKQPGGGVGRPKSVFVLKEHYVPSKMELSPVTVKLLAILASRSARPAVAATPALAPAAPAPVSDAPAAPAPVSHETVRVPDTAIALATPEPPIAG